MPTDSKTSPVEALLDSYIERVTTEEEAKAKETKVEIKERRFLVAEAVQRMSHDQKWIGQATLMGIWRIYKDGGWTRDGMDKFDLWVQQFIQVELTDDYLGDLLRIHKRVLLGTQKHRIIDKDSGVITEPEEIINEVGIGKLKLYSQLMASTDDTGKHVEYLGHMAANKKADQASTKEYVTKQMGKNTITLPAYQVHKHEDGTMDVGWNNLSERQFSLIESLVARYTQEVEFV